MDRGIGGQLNAMHDVISGKHTRSAASSHGAFGFGDVIDIRVVFGDCADGVINIRRAEDFL